MKFARQKDNDISLDLTPLIDVVFLLLIFFMVSMTFDRETVLNVELPEASGEHTEADVKAIDIQISVDGKYAVNDKPLVDDELKTLKTAMAKISDGDTSIPLLISADRNAPHHAVVRAMDAAGQLGFSNLSIATSDNSGN
ncbi:MAG: biopolymer transporter ExbD [Pseudomonadales bacterium]|nr:biopolymer transporter ExbD [Pseudomonadales bacterium]